jgi:P-type conjugative transfer protein TrbJ
LVARALERAGSPSYNSREFCLPAIISGFAGGYRLPPSQESGALSYNPARGKTTLAAPPAQAQIATTVYDPTNYSQNLLSAARALTQINNQIASLQNEAQSLLNEGRNLTRLPTSALGDIQQSMDRTRQLIGEAQKIAYQVKDIDRIFDARYPAGSLEGTSSGRLVESAEERWSDAVGAFQDALRTQATVVGNIEGTRAQLGSLVGASQDAVGALQAAQAGNQLIALQTRQIADLTALVAAQGRADAIKDARAAADEALARERGKRFRGAKSDYQPREVSIFND